MGLVLAQIAAFLASVGVHLPAELPPVQVLPQAQLRALAGLEHAEGNTLRGLCLDGGVYLDATVDLDTVEGRAVLVHELTHLSQHGCPRGVDERTFYRNEARAYAVQNIYLRANNSLTRVYNPYPRFW